MVELDEETTVIARGAFWQNLTGIAVKLLAFIYTIIIARFVVQEQVGLFYFGLGVVGTISIFADLGLSQAIIRYVPYYIGKKDERLAHQTINVAVIFGVLLLSLCSLFTYFFAGSIAAFFQNPPLEGVLVLLAFYLAIIQSYTIANSLLFAFKRAKEAAFGATLQSLLKLIFLLLLIFPLGANAQMLAIGFTASYAFSAFYLLFELRKSFGWLKKGSSFTLRENASLLVRELLPFGLIMVGSMAFAAIIISFDRLLLGYFLKQDANAQIAIYSLATNLAGLCIIFSGSITSILFPVASELVGREHSKDRPDWSKVNKTSQTALKWVLFSSVPLTAFLAAFSAPMLRILYGIEYEPGGLALSIFTFGMFVSYITMIQRTVLIGMRLMYIDALCLGVGAAVNIGLNWLLIPMYGISGSAFASFVAFLAMSLLTNHYARTKFGFQFPLSAWKNIAAGAMVFAMLLAIQIAAYPSIVNLPLSFGDGLLFGVLDKLAKLALLLCFFAIGSFAYLVLINLLRLFEHDDVQVFRQIFSKFGFPAWVGAFFVRLVFWNQKELH
ncbi:Polysaccharide biosynthesis protein [Candidatus Anstonella stagnisolia]|nr:Polysaccharide biosynthesis protein [Candidatus Anstonella stagnisolia]